MDTNRLSGNKPNLPVLLSSGPSETEPFVQLGVAGVGHFSKPNRLYFFAMGPKDYSVVVDGVWKRRDYKEES